MGTDTDINAIILNRRTSITGAEMLDIAIAKINLDLAAQRDDIRVHGTGEIRDQMGPVSRDLIWISIALNTGTIISDCAGSDGYDIGQNLDGSGFCFDAFCFLDKLNLR